MKATPKLQRTSNYDRFKTHPWQRSIKKTNVERLSSYMKAEGFNPSKPLTVQRKGRALELVDGHHRLEAARKANVPVYFVEVQHNGIIPLNVNQQAWGAQDYLMHYVREGRPEYIKLYDLVERFGLGLSLTVGLAAGRSIAHTITHSFRNGSYKVVSPEVVKKTSAFANSVKASCGFSASRGHLTAFARCLPVKGFDKDRMAQAVKTYGHRILSRGASMEDAPGQLEEVYNFRRTKGNLPLAFLARKKK
jgi:hypothetical protein